MKMIFVCYKPRYKSPQSRNGNTYKFHIFIINTFKFMRSFFSKITFIMLLVFLWYNGQCAIFLFRSNVTLRSSKRLIPVQLNVSCETDESIIVTSGPIQSWMRKYNLRIVECSVESTACPKVSARERDSESFLSFVSTNYHCLPNRVIFLHGHARSWHQPSNFVDLLDHALNSTPVDTFVHLGVIRAMTKRWKNTGWCVDIWKPTLNMSCPMNVNTYQGMQFITSRKHIQHTKLQSWIKLRNISLQSDTPLRNGYFTEWVIHILLGQPAKLWTQHECNGIGFSWTCGRRQTYQ